MKFENMFKDKYKELEKPKKSYEQEIENILALITSNISKNKWVVKITKTNIKYKNDEGEQERNEFVAYLENGVQFWLEYSKEKELAERYLEIQNLTKNLKKNEKPLEK